MLRFLRHNHDIKIAFDAISVYLSAIFEKLLTLYIQCVEKTRNQRTCNELFQQHKSFFDVFSKFEDSQGICIKSRRAFESLLNTTSTQPNENWKQRWLRNYELGLRLDENAKKSLFYFVKCSSDSTSCNCAQKQ